MLLGHPLAIQQRVPSETLVTELQTGPCTPKVLGVRDEILLNYGTAISTQVCRTIEPIVLWIHPPATLRWEMWRSSSINLQAFRKPSLSHPPLWWWGSCSVPAKPQLRLPRTALSTLGIAGFPLSPTKTTGMTVGHSCPHLLLLAQLLSVKALVDQWGKWLSFCSRICRGSKHISD